MREEGSKERGEKEKRVVIHLYRNWQRSGRRGGDWREGEGREGEKQHERIVLSMKFNHG